MKKLLLVVLAVTMFTLPKVNADSKYGTLVTDGKIDGIYYYKHRNDTANVTYEYHNFHEEAYIYKTSKTGEIAYCIESWEPLTGATSNDYNEQKPNLTDDVINTVSRLAYFGYGYKDNTHDHTNPKWYAITQLLIWQKTNPQYEHYLVGSISSTTSITNNYSSEISELMNLINEEMKYPSINNVPNSLFLGEKYILKDESSILDKFTVSATYNITAKKKSSSEIELEGNLVLSDSRVILEKEFKRYSHKYATLVSNNYQNYMVVGNINALSKTYKIPVKSGKITVNTTYTDYETGNVFSDVEIKIYNENNILINTSKTNEYGEVIFDNVRAGIYTIELENKEDDGFLPIDNQIVNITSTNPNKNIYVTYIPQALSLSINKLLKNDDNVMESGSNIEFELYNEKDELIDTLITDENGNINKNYQIKYGNYYLIETKTKEGYELLNNKVSINFFKEGTTPYRNIHLSIINNKIKEEKEVIIVPNDEIPKDKEEKIEPVIEEIKEDIIMPDTSLDHINVLVPSTLSNSFNATILLLSLLFCLSLLCIKRLFYYC